ncbi:Tn3 family transposase, partial [Klebsiella pneumoniae]
MNETNKRKVPDDAPLDFVPKRFQNHIFDSKGNIDKTYYELAALTKLKDYIRSGDIHVTDSRKYKDLEEYFVPEQEWVEAKEKGTTGLYVPLTAKEYIADRKRALADRLYWLSKNINSLEGVSLEDGKIHVDRLEKETPEEAEQLSKKLYSLLPRVK